jgi:TIR domain
MEKLGHSAIYDALALEPGSNWRDVLLRALASSDAVVVFLTENALHSHFVMGEIGMARALQHALHKPLLLPIIIGDIGLPTVVSDLFTIPMVNNAESIGNAASEIIRALGEYQDRMTQGYPKIFISHRHIDAPIVEALTNVIGVAFDIEAYNIRCTSVHPYRLKAGDRTSERLRIELQRAEAVLGIISPDVKASSYVLFELGASWGRSGITFPLLVRGATAVDVPAPIGDLHTLSLSDETECYQLLDDLADVVSIKRRSQQGSVVADRIQKLVGAASKPYGV